MLETTTGPDRPVGLMAPPTPAAPLPVPPVRVGSHTDAKALRGRIQQLLAGIGRADETVRLLCETAREKKVYLLLEDPRGRFFKDWTAFCTAPVPWGLGLDEGLLAEVARERSDPKRLARLALEAPLRLRPTGGQPGARTAGAPRQPTRGTDYRLQRLKRDRPDLLQQLASGELPSITAAWRQAGLHLPTVQVLLDPQNVARLIVTRLTRAEQQEVLDLLRHPEKITPPAGGRCPHWEAYRARTVPPEVLAREQAERRAAAKQKGAEYARKRRAQAAALGLPSLAVDVEAAG